MRRLRMMATLVGALVALLAVWTPAAGAVGGPVIMGGDDLTDHGSTDSAGTSQDGYLYMEKAIGNVKAKVGRANDNSIAAFGSEDEDPGPLVHPSGGNAGERHQERRGEERHECQVLRHTGGDLGWLRVNLGWLVQPRDHLDSGHRRQQRP